MVLSSILVGRHPAQAVRAKLRSATYSQRVADWIG